MSIDAYFDQDNSYLGPQEYFFTSIDEGRLHIAADDYYQGSVKRYDDSFLQNIASLFGISIKIKVSGEEHWVNRSSYKKFLGQHGVDVSKLTTAELKNFDGIRSFKVIHTDGYMRHHLSAGKTSELAQKLFNALLRRNMAEATTYIKKGANVDTHAWIKESTGELFFTPKFADLLPATELEPTKFLKVTPTLLALKTHQTAMARCIFHFGADPFLEGESFLFSRHQVNEGELDVSQAHKFLDKLEARVGISLDLETWKTKEWDMIPNSLELPWMAKKS